MTRIGAATESGERAKSSTSSPVWHKPADFIMTNSPAHARLINAHAPSFCVWECDNNRRRPWWESEIGEIAFLSVRPYVQSNKEIVRHAVSVPP